MPEIDYRALARRIRSAHEIAAARENPKRLAEGGVRLADVLDLLTSAQGATLEEELHRETEAAIAETRHNIATGGAPPPFTVGTADCFLPKDPFRHELAHFFDTLMMGLEGQDPPRALVPQAVVEAFANAAGAGGVLTDDVALSKLGPVGLRMLQKCRALLERGAPKSDRPDSKLEDVGVIAAEQLMRSRDRPEPLARMPVLDELTRLLGAPDLFKGVHMAAVQHLFPSTEGLFHALMKNGLRPESTMVGGKGYSTDAETAVKLQAQGFGVHHLGRALAHGGQNAEDVVKEMARDELRTLFDGVDPSVASAKPKFLLLDEGGKLIKLLHEEFPQYAHLCVAVEQTDRGIQVIEEMKARGVELKCPVVNMARCDAKKIWESPMIGESCVHNVDEDLASMHLSVSPKVAAVIGYGAVGKAVADRLRARGYEVWVYDKDPAAMARAAADGCTAAARDDVIEHGHLLYGCTGQGAIGPDDYEKLPAGAVLANAASGNHELGEVALELARDDVTTVHGHAHRTFAGVDVDLGDAQSPMRHGVLKTKSGKEILFMRSGYVCNMGKDIPPEVVQLIRGLLLASCLQAMREKGPGLKDVNHDAQALLVSRVNKLLARFGTSLGAPDFRTLP